MCTCLLPYIPHQTFSLLDTEMKWGGETWNVYAFLRRCRTSRILVLQKKKLQALRTLLIQFYGFFLFSVRQVRGISHKGPGRIVKDGV